MKKLEVIPFHLEHLKLMEIREHELNTILTVDDLESKLDNLQKVCNTGTMVYDGRILGVMGFFEMWKGVCEVWILPSKYVAQYGLAFAKKVKQNLKQLKEVHGMHRIQTTTLDDEIHNRWMLWLGFKCEGTLKNYSIHKQDYKMWSEV